MPPGEAHPDAQAGGGHHQPSGRVFLRLPPHALTAVVTNQFFLFGTETVDLLPFDPLQVILDFV